MKRLSRLSAIALGAMLSTVAVPALVVSGAATEAQAATLSGGFDVGPGGFQGNFNPLAATAGFTWLSIYYEPLVSYDEALQKVVGALASSYEVSPDQMTYTFKLADAKWHDGKPFTAKDAKFTIGLATRCSSPAGRPVWRRAHARAASSPWSSCREDCCWVR
ncbi:ABC-type transport system substrate-binding protein [Rhizobium sp. BK008]|nr:ABC-type transport system substrate-binding protein [Rhizobium sp. BK008]